jgi:hypothetical protein
LVPAARPVDAAARIEAIAIPTGQFRLLKEFIVDFFDFLSFVILPPKEVSFYASPTEECAKLRI